MRAKRHSHPVRTSLRDRERHDAVEANGREEQRHHAEQRKDPVRNRGAATESATTSSIVSTRLIATCGSGSKLGGDDAAAVSGYSLGPDDERHRVRRRTGIAGTWSTMIGTERLVERPRWNVANDADDSLTCSLTPMLTWMREVAGGFGSGQ